MRLTTCDEVLAALDGLGEGAKVRGPFSVGQVLAHCAQSMEYSLTGFPEARGWIVRAVIGPRVMAKFLRQGFMKHDLGAPIPGAPGLPEANLAEGSARLRAAIAAFRAHQGAMAPHFAYGPVTKEQYEKLHAMHVADHLSPG